MTAQAGVVPGFGLGLQVDTAGDNTNLLQRNFPSQTGTVYLGILLRRNTAFNSNEFIQLYLNSGGSDNTGASTAFRNTAGSPIFARVAAFSNNQDNSTASAPLTTYQVVLKISKFSSTTTNYSRAEVFVDQATEATLTITSNGDATIASLSQFHIRVFNVNSGDQVYVDELRVATTYAEALAVPEPASALLLALGGLGLFARRRRSVA